MTEHLPECPVIALLIKGNSVAAGSCICSKLRACEQRPSTHSRRSAMTEHLQECQLSEPCDIDITEHGFCSMQVEEQFFCIHCMSECICTRLRTCEARVLRRVLEAAREVIDDLPAPYKMRGAYETFGPYHEGKSDFKDTALSAIDALLEGQQ